MSDPAEIIFLVFLKNFTKLYSIETDWNENDQLKRGV